MLIRMSIGDDADRIVRTEISTQVVTLVEKAAIPNDISEISPLSDLIDPNARVGRRLY